MTDASAPAASAGPPPTADPQDPLPESNWKWRRWYVFGATTACSVGILVILVMLYRIARVDLVGRQTDKTTLATIEALYQLGRWLVFLTLVDRVLYLIAPSAEQATKMLATVSALKSGVGFASSSKASGPQGEASSASTAGPAAVAPVPPAPPIPPIPPAPPAPPGPEPDLAP
jgi:hypothetical protein